MDILLNPIIKAVGWTIIHSLWQGAIVYLMLVGALKIYPKMKSGSKCNLSFFAMLGMLGWALLTFINELVKSNNTIASGHSYGLSRSIVDNLPSLTDQSIALLVMSYLIGICFHISSLIFDFYKVNRLRSVGLIDLTSDLQHRFSELASSVGIIREVRFKISSKVTVPIVVGYLKPIILFPVSVITQLDSRQLESIVIHELSHIRRNDYLFNLLKIFMETLLFFNPFVLMTGKIINIEREQACDDLVVEMTNDPLAYVETLLEIQKLKFDQERFSMALTSKNYQLLNRIKRIAAGEARKSPIKQPIALLLICVAFLSLALIPIQYRKVTVKPASNSYKELKKVSIQQKEATNTVSKGFDKNDKRKKQRVNKLPGSLHYPIGSSVDSIVSIVNKPIIANILVEPVTTGTPIPESDRPRILNIRRVPKTNDPSQTELLQ